MSCVARCLALTLLALPASSPAQDPVPVPGGPASIRRLMGLDPDRPPASFFVDLHEVLLFGSSEKVSWSKIEGRRRLVDFADDLREWREDFGNPASFAVAPKGEWKRTERALEWLGFKVRGEGRGFTTQRREDEESARRQGFLDAVGMPLSEFLEKLHAGETVSIGVVDDPAPLPFGLAAWRVTVDEPGLSAPGAFLFFVKNVRASRMLVALHALDPETREALRTLVRDQKGRQRGWAMLYEDTLETFSRYPEALMLRDGQVVLPGGKEADPIWTDIFGASPSNRAAFLAALFDVDDGKAAYVVDTLQHLPDSTVRELLFGKTGGGQKAVKRFRRLYKSFDRAADNFELTRRDPYDFAQLAPFIRLSDEGTLVLPAVDSDGGFPRSDAELSGEVAEAKGSAATPEEALRRVFRRDTTGKAGSFPGQRRFLFASNLVEQNPQLADAGLMILLYRGLDRFLPAYAVLQDLPLDKPDLAKRYLFALDRLDRRSDSREKEVAIGLFQGHVELLARLSRADAVPPEICRTLFSELLALPLFAQGELAPAAGEAALYQWLSGRLLATLRAEEGRLIEARRAERARLEQEYRRALEARDERILARLAAARAADEARRAAAEATLADALRPECGPDDERVGPAPPRFVVEGLAIADLSPADDPTGERAAAWVEEALDTERLRAAPLPEPAAPRRVDGEIAGTTAMVDAYEPLPRLTRVEVPEEIADPDDLLSRALIGRPAVASFEWRGGRYRFDPAADAAARRRAFRQKQRLTWLFELEAIHRERDTALAAAGKRELASARKAAAEEARLLRLARQKDAAREGAEDERILKEEDRARDAAEDIAGIGKPDRLSKMAAWMGPLDALVAERHLEALLGHVYAASAGNPDDLYYENPDFARRHSFRTVERGGRTFETPFMKTALVTDPDGKGARVAGSLFGLPDVLGLLHADQLAYGPGAGVPVEEMRTGLVAPVWRTEVARVDDDALKVVAASCRAADEIAPAVSRLSASERFQFWDSVARDLVPRARLGLLASLDGDEAAAAIQVYLTPSDRYRIGRRLATRSDPGAGGPEIPSAAEAREALRALESKHGAAGARARLAEFGPRPVAYAGSFRLSDMEMPPYERLAAYRFPQILSDRLYDLKIAVACRMAAGDLPAVLLPLVLPAALDGTLVQLKMAYPYDWPATVRAASRFSSEDLDRVLDEAVRAGRITRDEGPGADGNP